MQKQKSFKEIKKREKIVDKERFMKYFDYEPSTLMIQLSNQNPQDLKKTWTKLNSKRLNETKVKEIIQITKMKTTYLI